MEETLLKSKMESVLGSVTSDIGSIRTGRATPSLVETVVVSVYGGTQKLKLNELATISAPDTQTLVLDPWDKSIIGEIRQGILAANIGMNPSIDGELVRISLPSLTTEDREKYIKILSTKLESGRVMVRQIRADGMHEVKKAFEEKTMTEDEKFAAEKRLQELTDEYTKRIDDAGDAKKNELLSI